MSGYYKLLIVARFCYIRDNAAITSQIVELDSKNDVEAAVRNTNALNVEGSPVTYQCVKLFKEVP